MAYQLALPPAWHIHDVFHASLLSPYSETPTHGPNFSRPPPDLIDGEAEYEVEQIRNHRHFGRNKTLQYLVKWKGYPESDNTWEPARNIHAPDILKTYHRKMPVTNIKATHSNHGCPIALHPGVLQKSPSLLSLYHSQVPRVQTQGSLSPYLRTCRHPPLFLHRTLLPIPQ